MRDFKKARQVARKVEALTSPSYVEIRDGSVTLRILPSRYPVTTNQRMSLEEFTALCIMPVDELVKHIEDPYHGGGTLRSLKSYVMEVRLATV